MAHTLSVEYFSLNKSTVSKFFPNEVRTLNLLATYVYTCIYRGIVQSKGCLHFILHVYVCQNNIWNCFSCFKISCLYCYFLTQFEALPLDFLLYKARFLIRVFPYHKQISLSLTTLLSYYNLG